MKRIYLLILCCCALLSTSAQYNSARNDVWAFGHRTGLDFTSGSPIPFTSGIATDEGCAAICDNAGNLLFYTDGDTLYNRLGSVMPGSVAFVPFLCSSSSQSAVIVPFINDSNKYYVFFVENYVSTGRLAYTVVDMTLAGGLGDVVGSAGMIIGTGMGEKLIAIPGNACNMWLMTHKKDTTQFYAYEITTAGVSTSPVISSVGTFIGPDGYTTGAIKCSHDRQRIASTSYPRGINFGVELYDFDPMTGIVSNCLVLESNPPGGYYYSTEFSPDNTKLYATSGSIYQWDIALTSATAILSSKATLSPWTSDNLDLRTGPDGKIYVVRHLSGFIDCINVPNAAGSACGYIPNAVNLSPGLGTKCFPNLVWNTPSLPGAINGKLSLCETFSTLLNCTPTGGTWSSSSSNATVSASGVVTGITPGTATITYMMAGGCYSTAIMTTNPLPAAIAGPTTVAAGSAITLSDATSGGSWTSGDSTKAQPNSVGVITGMAPGTATIYYTLPTGCKASVVVTVTGKNSVWVTSVEAPKPSLYPNPATNEIILKAERSVFTSFAICNAVGQQVATQDIIGAETKINIKAFPPGEYQVVFKGNAARELIRFTKW